MIGEKGKAEEIDRIITVKMYDNFYEPNQIKVKKNDYKSLLSEVLKLYRELDYNVKVEEK